MTNMTRKFAPGPWTIKRSREKCDGAYDFAINVEGSPVIAEAFGRDSRGGWLNAEANARLIAAAPDLEDVLDGAPIASQYHGPHGFDVDRFLTAYETFMARRRAVLAKAYGER